MPKSGNNPSFLLFTEYEEQLHLLSDVEVASLIRAIFRYCNSGKQILPDSLSLCAQMVFISIRQSIDRNDDKYAATVEQRRENGSKGGRPPQADNQREKKPRKPVGFDKNRTENKKPFEDENENQNESVFEFEGAAAKNLRGSSITRSIGTCDGIA